MFIWFRAGASDAATTNQHVPCVPDASKHDLTTLACQL
jgi:hypothetical protein